MYQIIRMSKKIILCLATMCVFVFSACKNPTCKSKNDTFNTLSPDHQQYKSSLAEAFHKTEPGELTYWLNAYWRMTLPNKAAKEFIMVHVKGDELCADMVLEIRDSKKGIEDILQKQMMGYKGAMLEGLKYDTKKDSSGITFVFKEVSHIND